MIVIWSFWLCFSRNFRLIDWKNDNLLIFLVLGSSSSDWEFFTVEDEPLYNLIVRGIIFGCIFFAFTSHISITVLFLAARTLAVSTQSQITFNWKALASRAFLSEKIYLCTCILFTCIMETLLNSISIRFSWFATSNCSSRSSGSYIRWFSFANSLRFCKIWSVPISLVIWRTVLFSSCYFSTKVHACMYTYPHWLQYYLRTLYSSLFWFFCCL